MAILLVKNTQTPLSGIRGYFNKNYSFYYDVVDTQATDYYDGMEIDLCLRNSTNGVDTHFKDYMWTRETLINVITKVGFSNFEFVESIDNSSIHLSENYEYLWKYKTGEFIILSP